MFVVKTGIKAPTPGLAVKEIRTAWQSVVKEMMCLGIYCYWINYDVVETHKHVGCMWCSVLTAQHF